MAKRPTINTLTNTAAPSYLTELNQNFTNIKNQFDNTLSLDGSTPNAMNADIDLNGNDLINANSVSTTSLRIGGENVVASSATALAVKKEFETVALLLTDTGTYTNYAAGDYLRVVNGGYTYQVAASGASDHSLVTAGGVKLYALPSIGVFNSAAINGVASSTEHMRIAASGNVGIGTSSPNKSGFTRALTVNTTGNFGLEFARNDTLQTVLRQEGTGEFRISNSVSQPIHLETGGYIYASTGGAERLRIDVSGNVGIGTSSPSGKLDVAGNAYVSGAGLLAFRNSTPADYGYIGQGAINGGDASAFAIRAEIGGISFATNGANERMRLDASGNLGIGTTPAYRLDVFGSVRLKTGATGTPVIISTGGDSQGTLRFGSASTEYSINGGADYTAMIFNTNGSERARIDSAGNFITAGTHYIAQPAQTSKAAAATLTIAELLTGIIQYTGAVANLTLPTGTSIEGGVSSGLAVDRAFDFSVINTGAGIVTLVTNTGLTTVGSLAVGIGDSAMFRVRKTATNTYTVYRIC